MFRPVEIIRRPHSLIHRAPRKAPLAALSTRRDETQGAGLAGHLATTVAFCIRHFYHGTHKTAVEFRIRHFAAVHSHNQQS